MTVKEFKEYLDKFDETKEIQFINRMKYIDIVYDFKDVIQEDNNVFVIFDD
ncbi:MAG: hypothetical protein ACRCRT_06330 [Cetobacterium somerae]